MHHTLCRWTSGHFSLKVAEVQFWLGARGKLEYLILRRQMLNTSGCPKFAPCPVQHYGSRIVIWILSYAKHICFAKGGFMNAKLPLFPKYCLFIYFCYNTLHVIVPNLNRIPTIPTDKSHPGHRHRQVLLSFRYTSNTEWNFMPGSDSIQIIKVTV